MTEVAAFYMKEDVTSMEVMNDEPLEISDVNFFEFLSDDSF